MAEALETVGLVEGQGRLEGGVGFKGDAGLAGPG